MAALRTWIIMVAASLVALIIIRPGPAALAGINSVTGWVIAILFSSLALCFVYVIIYSAASVWWHSRNRPPSKPILCPNCGHDGHAYIAGGLWDGACDPKTGKRPGGVFGYGICNRCSSRWAQWDDAPIYVPSDEEWSRQVGSTR